MAYVAVSKSGGEFIFAKKPLKDQYGLIALGFTDQINLPPGTIRKLIGRDLTWSDEPVELIEESDTLGKEMEK